MNSSKIYNRIWFKMVLSIILFLVFVAAITGLIYYPYCKPYTTDHDYTMVFAGASIFTRGIDPNLVDEKTGENSYVLAARGAPLAGRYEMLNAALDNENIETVVIEASYYTLNKRIQDYTLEQKLLYFPKVMGLGNKISTAVSKFSFWEDEFDQLYAQMLYEGVEVWRNYIFKSKYDITYLNYRGYSPYRASDQQIKTAEEAASTYKSINLKANFQQEVMDDLESLIRLCQEHGLRTVLVTMPMSQKFIWQHTGLDDYRLTMCEIADRYNVTYYDFNLLEDIGTYLDDKDSYHDEEHLSRKGARSLSPVIGEILDALLKGNDIGYRFYETYEEAREHSVYMAQ